MKSRHSSQSAPASRRSSNSRSEGRSSSRSQSSPSNGARKAAPPTLWQKITALFTGKPAAKPAAASAKPSTHPANASPRRAPASEPSSPSRTSRKPEVVEVTTPRLYVGNLSFDAAENDLSELFNGVGQVVSVEVVSHKQTQRSKGFAFVQMQTVDEAKRAVLELHDKEFLGRKLVVSGAKSSDQHDDRSESRFAA